MSITRKSLAYLGTAGLLAGGLAVAGPATANHTTYYVNGTANASTGESFSVAAVIGTNNTISCQLTGDAGTSAKCVSVTSFARTSSSVVVKGTVSFNNGLARNFSVTLPNSFDPAEFSLKTAGLTITGDEDLRISTTPPPAA